MSDQQDSLVDHLRDRLRDLELEACAIRARVEEVRSLLAQAERRRPGRKPKVVDMLPPVAASDDVA